MFQEYLFSDKTKQTEVKKYKPEGITREISTIKNSKCWTVTYSVPKNDEQAAKMMSDLNHHMVETFHPTVLTNESSEYFCKTLFPLIHEFERKLRKLLYLKSALYEGEKSTENISELEEKDLGQIFELLFTDREFVSEVQKKIKKDISWQFSKDEIIQIIQEIGESKLWDIIVGDKSVIALRNDYLVVKGYRNDVMHAHSIDYETFKYAKKLFKNINMQLDEEIGRVVMIAEKEQPKPESTVAFNTVLSEALKNMKIASSVAYPYFTQVDDLTLKLNPLFSQYQEVMKPATEALANLRLTVPANEQLINLQNALNKAALASPLTEAMSGLTVGPLPELKTAISGSVTGEGTEKEEKK